MLTKKLPIHLVTGIVVYRAHKYVNHFYWYAQSFFFIYIYFFIDKHIITYITLLY